MDEKNKQLFETTLLTETAKQTAQLGKDVTSDIIRPTSKSIGDNLGLLVDGVMGWLGLWGQKQKIKQKQNLQSFKNNISSKINNIPKHNLKEPNINIAGPAIEASKYFFEEEYYKEMFANLIAASCDKSKETKIHPAFTEIIKQISPLEALILKTLQTNKENPIGEYILILNENRDFDTILSNVFISEESKDINRNAFAIDNLIRLNLVEVQYYAFSSKEMNNIYDIYKKTDLYLKYLNKYKERNYPKIELETGIIFLTSFGKNFLEICT